MKNKHKNSDLVSVENADKPIEKNKQNIRLADILKPVMFLVFATVLEMINFAFIQFKATGNATVAQVLPTYFFLDFAFYLVIAGFMFMARRKGANAIMYVFLGFQIAINCINSTLYKVFGDIFSFDMMKLGTEAVAAFKFDFIEYWSIIVNLAVLAVIITLQVLMDRKLKKEYELKKINRLSLVLAVFASCFAISVSGFCIQTLTFKDSKSSIAVAESDQYLWDNMQFKLEAYKKFGTYGFYTKSLANMIYKNDKMENSLKEEIKDELEEGQKSVNTSAELYGDNLIVIMLESFEWFAVDPKNTPTLWNLRKNTAVSFENFYSKNKTNMSEDIGILGNMPKDTLMSTLAKDGRLNNPYSLPNLFKQMGYTANYFHGYRKTFYDRDKVNIGMGFENVYGVEDVELENKSMDFNDWNLDSDYIKAMIDKFVPDQEQPFFSFFTTVTTHGTYARTNERFTDYYKEYNNNLEEYKTWLAEQGQYVYPEDKDLEACFRQYKCAAMDTDRMVAYLIKYLEEKGLADNTNIVMYADHNCYYNDIYFNIKGISKADFYDTYSYNVPAMIYSKKLGHQVNTTFMNTYDIYPTICELYGLPYNTALTQGFSVFSEDISKSIMVSYVSGMFKEEVYSLNIVDMYTTSEVSQEDLDRFKKDACRFYEKQRKIELIYKYKMF